MFDVLILGAGPAGISAALYAKRANKSVLVLRHGNGELDGAEKIENYYGFPGGISGAELAEKGTEQAKGFGIEIKDEEALNAAMNPDMTYKITTSGGEYDTKTLIIATGTKRLKPDIENFDALDGHGISYCAVCDGFFYRKKRVAVLGAGDYAVSEARELKNVTQNVTILTNGENAPDSEFETITQKIKAVNGQGKLSGVTFENGQVLELDGLFVAIGTAGGADFAKKLGILTDGNNIKIDENTATNAPGVFAAGNVTGGLLQVCKAVYEGAKAGLSAVNFLRNKK